MNEDVLNMSVRKFLKRVGVTSQREIESAIREADRTGRLKGAKSVDALMTLSVPELDLLLTVEEKLDLD